MGIRDLAQQAADQVDAEKKARDEALQADHEASAIIQCRRWFIETLKTNPDSIRCFSKYQEVNGTLGQYSRCIAVVEDLHFEWASTAHIFIERHASRTFENAHPAVRVVERVERFHKWVMEPVVADWQAGVNDTKWAHDLPSLGKHLATVERHQERRRAQADLAASKSS